ncbi:cytochrome C [Malaciobacter halophilus]|uniref:Cytochrome C n=1 Tax=Malaciobacter halophilus TaxID=197482 RepID=A0A2N1J1P2_9BACT|nr:cytochrome C [Malaciobacter halophilus]AXH08623.1 hypothetical protein AHALO_0212 [Malaciobacter halophilus]PKI80468.1 cytochrome C [Malaciobacter halophilus]
MTKFVKIALAAALALGVTATTAQADSRKGQKIFIKKLKSPCGMNGDKFAAKHSQDEWKEIKDSGNFENEIIKICPKVKKGSIKKSWQGHLFDFAYEYANDSGNVPSC